MGLLDQLQDIYRQAPDKLRGLLGEIKSVPGLLNNPALSQQVNAAYNQPQSNQLDPNQAINLGMNFVQPMGLMGHIVYHGSPHNFDRFDMSKIGKGEGAQAYGHGLYFAESPGVAKSYLAMQSEKDILRNLSADDIAKNYDLTKQHAEKLIHNWRNSSFYADEGGNATESFWSNVKSLKSTEIDDAVKANYLKYGYKSPEQMKLGLQKFINSTDMSNMVPESVRPQLYKVDIPDEAIPKMLDLDKPLSEQTPAIVSGLKAAYKKQTGASDRYIEDQFLPNKTVVEAIGAGRINSDMSNFLREQGIPGIRYKDAMSRGTDAGTSNYVLFNGDMARILEKNGQPTGLLSWADEANKVKQLASPYLHSPDYPVLSLPPNKPRGDTWAGYPSLEAYQNKLAEDAAQAERIAQALRSRRYGK